MTKAFVLHVVRLFDAVSVGCTEPVVIECEINQGIPRIHEPHYLSRGQLMSVPSVEILGGDENTEMRKQQRHAIWESPAAAAR